MSVTTKQIELETRDWQSIIYILRSRQDECKNTLRDLEIGTKYHNKITELDNKIERLKMQLATQL